MQSSGQDPGVKEHLLPADHQNCLSAPTEHFWNQSSTSSDSAFSVDFSVMEFNKMSWIDTVDNKSTEYSSTSFQSRSSGEDPSFTACSIESKYAEVSAGSQEVSLKFPIATPASAQDSSTSFQSRSSGEDQSFTACSIESKYAEVSAESQEVSLKTPIATPASAHDSSTSFQSRSSGEDPSFTACSIESKSDQVPAGSQEVPLKFPIATPASAQEASSLLENDVSAQEDSTTSHETSPLMDDDFPTLLKSLGVKNYPEHQMNNTLRGNAQKIICDTSRTEELTKIIMCKGDCNQGDLNNMTSKDVEGNSEMPEQLVLNEFIQPFVSRTWSSVVNTQSNSTAINLKSAQEVQELMDNFKDEISEQKNAHNMQSNVKDFTPNHEIILPTAQEIAETAKRSGSILDSIWQCFEELEQRRRIRIVDGLQLVLKTLYTKNMSQNVGFGSLSTFHFLPLSTAFDVSTLSKNGTRRKITTDKKLFPNCYKTNLKNVVLFGKPNYGKTTFCSCLAFNWTASKNFVLKCTLCVSVHVSQLKMTRSVSDALITFLCGVLKNPVCKKEEIRSALLSIEDSILFLIDGYDELLDDDERKMNRFLFDRTEFRKSTVLITARTVVNQAFGDKFEHVLFLGGFNFNHLLSRLKGCTISSIRITNFMERFVKDDRLVYLSELPPFFLNCACQLVMNFHYFREANSCVWPLLDAVTEQMDKKYLHSSGGNDSILVKLGKLMFEALATGYSSFTEQLLSNLFSDKLDLLRKSGVFYKEREWQSNMWTVSSKVLMVFYATFYLRHCWSKLKDVNERQSFLDNVFCFGDSVGNYLTAQNNSPRISCYVGVIPEVVLSFKEDGLLENAKFEMYHDVEAVEHSHAFDSTNLLVRIGKRHITRFGFRKLEVDDPKVGETFEGIFECLSLSDFCVDYEAYYNVYEDRSFLNVSVTDGDDSNVLRFVCRANDRNFLDRAYIEFDFAVLKNLFSFLSQVLLQVLNDIELDEDLMMKESCELVWCLLNSIFKSDSQSSVTLVCYDYSTALSKRVLQNVTFNIYKCPKRDSLTVEILSTLYKEERVSNFRVYKREEMLTENEMVLCLLKNWLSTAERPGISISIY